LIFPRGDAATPGATRYRLRHLSERFATVTLRTVILLRAVPASLQPLSKTVNLASGQAGAGWTCQ
jgi:uncharacterized RDD family membrane protein YckC